MDHRDSLKNSGRAQTTARFHLFSLNCFNICFINGLRYVRDCFLIVTDWNENGWVNGDGVTTQEVVMPMTYVDGGCNKYCTASEISMKYCC